MTQLTLPQLLGRNRELLRRFRDSNLSTHGGSGLALAGCSSLFAPVERGVSYRVGDSAGPAGELTITASPDGRLGVRLQLADTGPCHAISCAVIWDLDSAPRLVPAEPQSIPPELTAVLDQLANAELLRRIA